MGQISRKIGGKKGYRRLLPWDLAEGRDNGAGVAGKGIRDFDRTVPADWGAQPNHSGGREKGGEKYVISHGFSSRRGAMSVSREAVRAGGLKKRVRVVRGILDGVEK